MALCDRFFYHPTRKRYADPREYGLAYEAVDFATPDGQTLCGWFFPAVGAAHGTLVHCHGNAGNMSGHFELVRWLPEAGWNLLCFDYRGFGNSTGRPRRRGIVDDVHAAVEYVRGRADVDADSVALLGQSLGGAVGIVAVAEGAPVCGLVTDGAFDSYQGATRWLLSKSWLTWGAARPAARWLISAGLDPIDYAGRIAPTPLLIIQGTEDHLIDWHTAERLYEAASQPKELLIVEGAGHFDAFETAADLVRPKMLRFLANCVETPLCREQRA